MPVVLEIGIVIVVVVAISLGGRIGLGRGQKGPVLVLKRFDIDESEESETCVSIVGRPQGLLAWLLSVMGLDDETSLTVYRSRVEFKSASLFGQSYQIAPLPSVATTCCSFAKPFGLLLMGVLSFVGGIIGAANDGGAGAFFLGLLFSVGFLVAYGLSKKMMISVESSGGAVMGLTFKRSVIENVAVDISKVKRSIEIINDLVCKSQR